MIEAAQEGKDGTTHHDVVEVCNDEVGTVQVHIQTECTQEETGQTANGKINQESNRKEHRGGQLDMPLIHRRHPVKDLDRGRYPDKESQE